MKIMSSPIYKTFGLVLCCLFFLWTHTNAEDNKKSNSDKQRTISKLYAQYKKSFSKTPEITVSAFLALLKQKDKPVLVDVREQAERNVSIIPGAISKETFEANKETFRNKKIVVYCTIGYRSGLYAKTLNKEHFEAVNLIGSILAWTYAGQLLEDKNGKPTHQLHVYGKKWDLASDVYTSTWFDKKK